MIKIDLSGYVVVITGGSSGIGLACVKYFLEAGASVAFCARNQKKLDIIFNNLKKQFPKERIFAYSCDVLKTEELRIFASLVQENFGRTNILINNAGAGCFSTFASTTDSMWLEELEFKYFSLIRPTRAFLPMLRITRGNIVCTNSLLALQPESHMVATSSARAGTASLTKLLAIELASEGIRVNSILVGLIESAQWQYRYNNQANFGKKLTWKEYTTKLAKDKNIPLGRLGLPNEAAQAIFFLATSMSSYTTGSYIDVSGGLAKYV